MSHVVFFFFSLLGRKHGAAHMKKRVEFYIPARCSLEDQAQFSRPLGDEKLTT